MTLAVERKGAIKLPFKRAAQPEWQGSSLPRSGALMSPEWQGSKRA
jgi:hypothetical protein